jgi:hypothetical protein
MCQKIFSFCLAQSRWIYLPRVKHSGKPIKNLMWKGGRYENGIKLAYFRENAGICGISTKNIQNPDLRRSLDGGRAEQKRVHLSELLGSDIIGERDHITYPFFSILTDQCAASLLICT